MERIIIMARVADDAAWKRSFRTHKDIFKDYTAKVVRFAVNDGVAATLWEVKNAQKMLDLIQAPETIAAMAADGVDKDSVQVFLLDEKIKL